MLWWEARWTTWENNNSISPYWSKLPCSYKTNQGLSQRLQQQTCHFHHIPEDVQVTWGLGIRCRQRMPMKLPNITTAVTQRMETDYKTFRRSLANALGHPMSSNWQSSSPQHQMRRTKAMSTPEQDKRDSLSQKIRREGVMKRNKLYCNLTLKQLDGPFRTSTMFPREIIVISLPV